MPKTDFVHLHVHTEYSLLDGLARIEDLINKAQEFEMKSLAITDHGTMYGVIPFYNQAKDAGIKPIIGCEVYLAQRGHRNKQGKRDRQRSHLTLLCENNIGYQNLIKLVTRSHLDGFYYKPRIDYELLEEHAEGLICLTGCRSGRIPQHLINDNYSEAKGELRQLSEIMGPDNVFIELQVFNNQERDRELQESIKLKQEGQRLSQETGIGVVATNDVHYVEADDAYAQEILLCIQTKDVITDSQRSMSMIDIPEFYFKSPQEMAQLFPDLPQALENTVRIAERCHVEITTGKPIFPNFELPPQETDKTFLRKLVEEGLKRKFPEITREMQETIDYELEIIDDKGYNTYFLICHDLAVWARQKNIPISTRGSVTASLVAYALEITNINPLEYDLPFERFLNRERPSPPDIDFDIAEDKRDEVIDYVYEKYGRDHVAQIITFGRMEARAAIRDVARVLDLPYSVGDEVAKQIPFESDIAEALESNVDLKYQYESNPEIHKLIDTAQKIEGIARHASTHACGLVVTPEPLTQYVPLQKETKGGNGIITQYDMYALDINAVGDKALGLLKLDLLGLKNLTILRQTTQLIEQRTGEHIDIYQIPKDKDRVYEMLSQGHTVGVFQMESPGFQQLLKKLKPHNFVDVATAIALYRPGPMDLIPQYLEARKDPTKISYPHPDLKDILRETYGILIFQEQCMAVVSRMGGYTQGRADILRRAIGKKKKSLMMKEKKSFIQAAQKQGYSKEEAEDVFSYIESFARYGFNKSHTSAYALIAYQTAYFKYFYPLEYMTALFRSESDKLDKIPNIIKECQRLDLTVEPPDINQSNVHHDICDSQTIRFGLAGIKNLGEGVAQAIVAERQMHGPYADLASLCKRVDYQTLNKRSLESLIKSGALDEFGGRGQLLEVMSQYLDFGAQHQKKRINGQQGLFEKTSDQHLLAPRLPVLRPVPVEEKLSWERELLGVSFTPDPQKDLIKNYNGFDTHHLSRIDESNLNETVILVGIVDEVRKILTRSKHEEMAFVKVRGPTGKMEMVVFPRTYSKHRDQLVKNTPLLISGRISRKDEDSRLNIIPHKIAPLDNLDDSFFFRQKDDSAEIGLPKKVSRPILVEIKDWLDKKPGQTKLAIILKNGSESKRIRYPRRVEIDNDFRKRLFELLIL